MDAFGQKLRVAKGFSQAELARKINSHHSIVGKYERDEVNPTIDVVKKLAEVHYCVRVLIRRNERQRTFDSDEIA